MARKRIEDTIKLQSWEEVDKALKAIALSEIAITEIEGDLNKTISEAKEKATAMAAVHKEKIEEQEKLIKDYVETHKSDLDGKTKTLNFGQTGFRKSLSVSLPKGKDKLAAIMESLKKNGMEDCIKVEESINKDVLKKYDEEKIIRVGASLKKKDVFWYEVNLESVK
ncbi:MAG: host-nuclease inhibitor Gam family protein [Bacillota bacterium]|nr:host-nuclease inhibitor Gam family protein [Bacillota bacterium]